MDLIQTHQGAALLALIFMEITGALSLIGLWQYSLGKKSEIHRPARWNRGGGPAVFADDCRTHDNYRNHGRRNPASGDHFRSMQATSSVGMAGASIVPEVQYLVTQSSRYVWPVLEDLHFLRPDTYSGFNRGAQSPTYLDSSRNCRWHPCIGSFPGEWRGFSSTSLPGMLFFISMPAFYTNNPDFQIKMVAIVIAGTNLVLFYCTSAFRPLARLGPGDDAPGSARFDCREFLVPLDCDDCAWPIYAVFRGSPVGDLRLTAVSVSSNNS